MNSDADPLASENSDQMIRFNLFRFLSGKKCSSICPEKATENSIQMVNALGLIMVFDAISTARQSGQKLQYLYGYPIASNFFPKLNSTQFVNENVEVLV